MKRKIQNNHLGSSRRAGLPVVGLALLGMVAPGVYRFASRVQPHTLAARAAQQDWRCFYLDGEQVTDKASFLRVCAEAVEFPTYFGYNWDALEECIGDLSWAPAQGYVILYDSMWPIAAAKPDEWCIARSILASAVEVWRARGLPMFVLLRRAGRTMPDAPWL